MQTLLSPFPNGWFQVAWSDELAVGAVLPIHYFGEELVLFRAASGLPRVFDAHCPHLGAHLGWGGRVDGESIRCPFHGWCFDGAGRCTAIPYTAKIPPAASLRAWQVCERNGAIMLFHSDGGLPESEVPLAPQLADPDWIVLGRFRWQYQSHIQEMPDNAADPQHLLHLHGGIGPAECELSEIGANLQIVTRFMTDPGRLGFAGDSVPARIQAILHGVGMQIITFEAIASGLVFLNFTPIDGHRIDARMLLAIKRFDDEGMTAFVGNLVQKSIVDQFNEDVMIWEHKVYRGKPLLTEGDGPIGRLRRWCRQFYPGAEAAA